MADLHHPSRQVLESFVSGKLASDLTREVVCHLLTGCEECRQVTSEIWPLGAHPRSERWPEFESTFRRVVAQVRDREAGVSEERKRAEALLEELESHPPSRQLLLVLNSQRFHSWFLAELVLERVVTTGFNDPARALELAELGVALCDRLSEQRYGVRLINDLRARAWGCLGNARRVNSLLAEAAEAFQRGAEFLAEGTGDPLEEASFVIRQARFVQAQRDFRPATRLYDRAIAIYRRTGDTHLMGRTMIDKGTCYHSAGELDRAIVSTQEGLKHLDRKRDGRMALVAKHNLSLYLSEDGNVDQAMRLLKEILPLYAGRKNAMDLLRLRWLEGRLAQAQREFDRAEEAFEEVRKGFTDRGIPYDAATVSMDLATIYLEQGRYRELQTLASETLGIFRNLGVQREILAALELFRKATEARQLSIRWVGELATFLNEARSKPGLRFKPSGQAPSS